MKILSFLMAALFILSGAVFAGEAFDDGYAWAEEHNVTNTNFNIGDATTSYQGDMTSFMQGDWESFIQGVREYAEEQQLYGAEDLQ